MEMTLAEAATAVNMTKPGLLKAIRDGRLSAQKDANGVWKLESAELYRVYKPITKKAVTAETEYAPAHAQVSELMAKLEAAADVRRLLEERIAKVERERDQWQEQAARLLLALPAGLAPPTAAATAAVAPTPTPGAENGPGRDGSAPGGANGQGDGQTRKKRGFWRSIFGGGDNGE